MSEFKVGLLALATIIVVAVMSLKITSNQSGFGEYKTFRTIVRDASGIFPKTPIKVAGINAGRIVDIQLEGNQAMIKFEILKKIGVTKNSKLRIKTVGFLGDKYLEIYIGDSQDMLKEYDFLDSEEAAGIENLVKDTTEILGEVKTIVNSLKSSIAPEGEEAPVTAILNGVKEVVANTREVTATLRRTMTNNEEKMNNIIANLESFSYEIAYQVDKANQDSAMSDVKQILANTQKLTSDLQAIVADVKRGKGTLGKLVAEDEIADQVKDTLSSVQKLVGKADAIRTELEVFTGANTESGANSEVGLRIFPSPERFYLLGIATSEFGPEYEKETTTVTNGTTSFETKREREKDTYRFNIQVGRKIHDFAVRGGLIESTGGVGIDYFIPTFGTKFSLEVFDYRKNIGPNVRVSAEAQIWNVLYGRATMEDSVRKERSGTVSAGLRFNDEDLKGLLGFFL
ncbi:MAG: MlaD family protein [Bacteriovoracaceae bacterium]|nr:MlaD family protein [Bacteriovoracaceae bacterium]